MVAEERFDDVGLIGLVAAFHHCRHRAVSDRFGLADRDGGEGQRRRAFEVARHQETAGRQGRERVDVLARLAQIGGEPLGDLAGAVLVGFGVRVEAGERRAPVGRERRAGRGLAGGEGLARPSRVGFVDQRQVEQPFAGIIDEVERQPAVAAVPAGGALELDGQAQLRDAPGRLRPHAVRAGEARHMILVGEARHGVVGLRLEPRPGDASLRRGCEHRQPDAGDEIADERGQEHRLAGAGKAGDAEPQPTAGEVVADRTSNELRLERKIGKKRQGGSVREISRAYLGRARRISQRVSPSRLRARPG